MSELQQLLSGFILVLGVTLFVALVTAPFEAMSWWSHWTATPLEISNGSDSDPTLPKTDDPNTTRSKATVFYVTGIGTMAGDFHPDLEKHFLDELKRSMPYVTVIDNFFPYSPAGIPLTGQRIFARFWRYSGRHRALVTKTLIRLRNMFQVLVAADGRYGPIYSAGTFRTMKRKLLTNGHSEQATQPIILLGYSGGAEISLGAGPFLRSVFAGRLTLLSLGGVVSSHAGISAFDRIVHIEGSRDRVTRIGGLFFVHRWPLFNKSHWNKARKDGRITTIPLPGMLHNGPGGYLDDAVDDQGKSNLARTMMIMKETIDQEIQASQEPASQTNPDLSL